MLSLALRGLDDALDHRVPVRAPLRLAALALRDLPGDHTRTQRALSGVISIPIKS